MITTFSILHCWVIVNECDCCHKSGVKLSDWLLENLTDSFPLLKSCCGGFGRYGCCFIALASFSQPASLLPGPSDGRLSGAAEAGGEDGLDEDEPCVLPCSLPSHHGAGGVGRLRLVPVRRWLDPLPGCCLTLRHCPGTSFTPLVCAQVDLARTQVQASFPSFVLR